MAKYSSTKAVIGRLLAPFDLKEMKKNNSNCSQCHLACACDQNSICDFCWYDFQASSNERAALADSDPFRDRSVAIWYGRLGVQLTAQTVLSPKTLMHILHDCFRARASSRADTLKIATEQFPESVAWLQRLLQGTLPFTRLSNDVSQRVYKFSSRIGRTPIWYRPGWFWTPNLSTNQWIQCPILIVSNGEWAGMVPVQENIFIILFLHTYCPDPPYPNPNLAENFHRNEELFALIRQKILPAHAQESEEQMHFSEYK